MLKTITQRLMALNKDGSRSTTALYHRLFGYFKPYWFRAAIATFITIPIGALDGAIAFSLKPYIDSIQAATSLKNVSYVPLIIVAFTCLQGLLNYLSFYLNGWLGGRIIQDIRRDLFRKLQTLDISYFDSTASATVINCYFQDPATLQTNILNYSKQMLTRLFSSACLISVLIATSWKLSIIAITVMLFVLLPSTSIRKIIKRLAHSTFGASADILGFYTETAGGIRAVYCYNMEGYQLDKFEAAQKSLFEKCLDFVKAQGWLTPTMHIIASVGIALIIWQGSLMVVSKELTAGGFVSFLAAMIMLYQPIKNLGSTMMNTQLSLMAAGRIFDLLDKEPVIQDRPGAVAMTGLKQNITFEDVSFEYIPGVPVLKNINLSFNKGETIAIVGASGGGKTTIASLLPRFYEINQGAIRMDGVDIRDLTLDSLRKNIALVMQDNFLFSGTIRQNILLGNPNASDEAIRTAIEQAYLTEFIASLDLGLDTEIGERGVMLSGGQRQRVAIARAILKDAPIVILDEATSALDNQSEAIVQKALESLMKERTVVVIAHRLSTIRNADRILVMDGGQVVEEGSHDHLLAKGQTYAALYQTQFQTLPDVSPVESSAATAMAV